VDALHQRSTAAQVVSAHAAATPLASKSAGAKRSRLRRRATPEALARQALRKMEVLRAAYRAYRAHFRGSPTAMLRHLQEGASAGDDAANNTPLAERTRLELLRKDYLAALDYYATGELPEQVFSESLGLAITDTSAIAWLSDLPPDRRQRVLSALNGAREYHRLGLHDERKRSAWLAKDDGQGVRHAMLDIMSKANTAVRNAHRMAQRARARASRLSSTSPAPAAAAKGQKKKAPQPSSTVSPAKPKPDRGALGQRQRDRDWLKFLTQEERHRAEATRASYNEYRTLRKQAVDAGDDDGSSRRALLSELYDGYLAHKKLYQMAVARRKAQASEAATEDQQAARDESECRQHIEICGGLAAEA
jgi:hypothetical protein